MHFVFFSAYAQCNNSTNLSTAVATATITATTCNNSNIRTLSNRKRSITHSSLDATIKAVSSTDADSKQPTTATAAKVIKLYNGLLLGDSNNNNNNTISNAKGVTHNTKSITTALPSTTPAAISLSMPMSMPSKQNGYQSIISTSSHAHTAKSRDECLRANNTPAINSIVELNSITAAAPALQNGIKLHNAHQYADTVAAAFYQANGKLSLLNGSSGGGNGIILKDTTTTTLGGAIVSPLLLASTAAGTSNAAVGGSATYSNLAQIIAASTLVSTANSSQNNGITVTTVPYARAAAAAAATVPHERYNGKINATIGGQALSR